MIVRMVRDPVLLYETLGMVCKAYRRESYSATAESLLTRFGAVLTESQIGELKSNAAIADQVMNTVCADLDCEADDVKFFFEPFETGEAYELNCVARVLVLSMMGLKKIDFDEAIEETKRRWTEVKKEGIEVLDFHMHGVSFVCTKGRPTASLFEQIYAMDYPHKAKMDSFLALEKHEYYLDKLADILRPYARRLKDSMVRLEPIYNYTADNWGHYLKDMPSDMIFELLRIDEKTQLHMLTEAAVSLFLFNEIGNCFDDIPSTPNELTTLYIGVSVYPQYAKAFAEQQVHKIAEIVKSLADPVRMAILARLYKAPDYCYNISLDMDLNPGNVSRHLTLLYEYGLGAG